MPDLPCRAAPDEHDEHDDHRHLQQDVVDVVVGDRHADHRHADDDDVVDHGGQGPNRGKEAARTSSPISLGTWSVGSTGAFRLTSSTISGLRAAKSRALFFSNKHGFSI
jgi:hypothetical protein